MSAPVEDPALLPGGPKAVTPTQIAFPGRAVVRTLIVSLVGVLTAYAAKLGFDLTNISAGLVDSLTAGVWAFVTSVAQWVITRPAVDRLLKKVMPILATTPRG